VCGAQRRPCLMYKIMFLNEVKFNLRMRIMLFTFHEFSLSNNYTLSTLSSLSTTTCDALIVPSGFAYNEWMGSGLYSYRMYGFSLHMYCLGWIGDFGVKGYAMWPAECWFTFNSISQLTCLLWNKIPTEVTGFKKL